MAFELLDSLSLPGDASKPNEDAFAHSESAAVVFDGATSLGDPLMPGPSDAAWIAQFGARRLLAHLKEGEAPRAAFAQRSRTPKTHLPACAAARRPRNGRCHALR